ncbi:MAG: hypothetical protein ACTS8S_03860 [Giesbergeria sp.]
MKMVVKNFICLFLIFPIFAFSGERTVDNRGLWAHVMSTKVEIVNIPNCIISYPFSPVPPNLKAEFQGVCKDGLAKTEVDRPVEVKFFSNGVLHSVAGIHTFYKGEGVPCGAPTGGDDYKWNFTDGEIWQGNICTWKKLRNSNAALRARDLEEVKRQENFEKFRRSLKIGDDTRSGLIIEIRGPMVKIQTNESQCTQRDHNGSCVNYVNTPAEKWFKLSDVYP